MYRGLERVEFLGLCIIHICVMGRGCNVSATVVVSVPVFDTLQNTGCVRIQFTLAA